MDSKKVPFENALTMTGFGRYNWLSMFLVSTMQIGMAVETTSVAYLVPASACELNTTPEQQGLIAGMPLCEVSAATAIFRSSLLLGIASVPQALGQTAPLTDFTNIVISSGILLASNVWGYYADTRGRRKMLIIAMIMGFIAGCAATFSPNWIVFSVLKFISCAAMAGTYGLSSALLSEFTPEAHRPKFLMLLTTIFASSIGTMAVVTIPVLPLKFSYYIPYLDIHFNSWRLLNIIYSLACALGAVGSYFSLESPKFLLSTGREEEALDVLRTIYAINSGEDRSHFKVHGVTLDEDSSASSDKGLLRSVINQTVPLFKPPLLRNTLLLSAIFITVYFCVSPFNVWVPYMIDGFMKSLAKGETGLTFCEMLKSSQNETSNTEEMKPNDCTFDSTAMVLVFGMDLILSVMNIVISLLLPCIGRKTMFIGLQMIVGIAALLVNSSSIWVLTAFLIIVFIHGMLNFGVLNTFSVDMYPTYVKAMGVCFTLMIGRGSAVLGINLLKTLLTYYCDAVFYVFGSISIVGGFLAFLLPSDKNTPQEETEEQSPKQISS